MIFRVLPLIFFLFITACAETPSGKAGERGFDQEKLEEFNSSSRFDYDRDIEPYSNPVLKILGTIFSWMSWLFNSFLGYFLLGLLACLLIYIIVKNSSAIFSRHADAENDAVVEFTEDHIESIDYDKLLNLALAEKDYRLAIRYTFLKSLKLLQQAELIQWHKEKTNHQYLVELPEAYRSEFRKIISYFEYTWYGQIETSEALYDKVASKTEAFHEHLKLSV